MFSLYHLEDFEYALKRIESHVLRDRRAVLIRDEDEVVLFVHLHAVRELCLYAPALITEQLINQHLIDRDLTVTVFRFWCSASILVASAFNRHCFLIKVDVPPPQTKRFTSAKASKGEYKDERIVRNVLVLLGHLQE